MGHVIQLRREGVKASAPLFIPFLGAVVWAKSLGGNALAEARVGPRRAGPRHRSAPLACLPIAEATGNNLFRALAFTGFFLNLFNLAPVLPLDGGRAMAAMAPWMWIVGLGVMIGAAFAFPNPIIILILLFGGDGDLAALEAAPRGQRGDRRPTTGSPRAPAARRRASTSG